MSLELGLLNYNNYETIDITEGETDIIHISDDFLLNSNEIHYNDNHTFITVHYDEKEELEMYDLNDNNFINHDNDDFNYYGENETWINLTILNIGFYHEELNCNELLFDQSAYTCKDLARFLYSLKSCHLNMGDSLFGEIIGLMATFLPKGNQLQNHLLVHPTNYKLLQLIETMADVGLSLRTFQIDTCINGCYAFMNGKSNSFICEKCLNFRYKNCNSNCYDDEGGKLCKHESESKRTIYYNCIEDRIRKLLLSDFFNFFHYPTFRKRSKNNNLIQDIYDTKTYKQFLKLCKDKNGEMIYIQMCWDGAPIFKNRRISMWPLCYSIMNFPPSLRDKIHIGLHVASFDDGSTAATEIFANELLHLWNVGIKLKDKTYYVCCPQIIMDGRGREKFMNVQVCEMISN